MNGWVYLIANQAMTGVIKIGCCEDHPEVITKKLDDAGGSPYPYILQYQLFLTDSFLILQNIRRALWALNKTAISGWCSISPSECIALIRDEVGLYIIDQFRMSIKRGDGGNDFPTIMRVIDAVLLLSENIYQERNGIHEVREIAMVVAGIMKNGDWMREGQWQNRITGKNYRYVSRS